MLTKSYIQKFMFEKLPVKGALVVLDDCWQKISSQQVYPEGLKQLLGELLAANVLITANLKLDGKVICQIQDNPHFQLVVSECSSKLTVRATAKYTATEEALLNYGDYLDKGRLVVSIDSTNEGNLYQSIIAFNGTGVAEILNNYMLQSEQLKSWFLIAYNESRIVGLMLQQLPDMHKNLTDEVDRIFMLGETLTLGELSELPLEQIIYRLFNEDNVVIYPEHQIEFACTCSYQRVSEILRDLGKDELNSMISEQGSIVVDCDYCNAKYRFSREELQQFVLQLSLDEIAPISKEIH